MWYLNSHITPEVPSILLSTSMLQDLRYQKNWQYLMILIANLEGTTSCDKYFDLFNISTGVPSNFTIIGPVSKYLGDL